MLGLRRTPLLVPLTLGLSLFALSGCPDEGDKEFTIYISINGGELDNDGNVTLADDGSETATIIVQVIDQDGFPAEDGSEIVILGTDIAQNDRTGQFGLSDGTSQQTLTLAQGSASTSFFCTEQVDVKIEVWLREPQVYGNALLRCVQRYSGDWYIESPLELDPQQVIYLSNSSIEVSALALRPPEDSEGDPEPVPPGTRILFNVTDTAGAYSESLGGFGGDLRQSQTRNTNLNGVATATFTTGAVSVNTDVRITAIFENENQGCGVECNGTVVFSVRPGGTSTHPGIAIVPESHSLPADGESETSISVFVYDVGDLPVSDAQVHFSLDNGTLSYDTNEIAGDSAFTEDLVGTADTYGEIELTYTASLEQGEARIEAWAAKEWFPSGPSSQVEASPPGQIDLVDIDTILYLGSTVESPLGIAGSGVNDQTTLFFQVLDSNDQPFPAGLEVDFSVNSTSTGAHVVPTLDYTDDNGEVSTILYAGSNSGLVSVTASAKLTEVSSPVTKDSDEFLVTGVLPSRSGVTLSCMPENIGALRHTVGDAINVPSSGNLCSTCRLQLRDRYGNPIGFPRQVSFLAESGGFEGQPVVQNNAEGDVEIVWCAYGDLPVDVDPIEGEPSWVEADSGDIRNPRDGLVTIVAWFMGEEEFDDRDRDGVLDDDEKHWDMSEPYVDVNDNNQYESDIDSYEDVEGLAGYTTGEFDEVNGNYDTNIPIWVQTRVLLTGSPYHQEHEVDPVVFTEFDGVDEATAPTELSLDADYPDEPYPMSHWYVVPASGGTAVNYYYPINELVYTCSGDDEFCFEVPSDWSTTAFNIWYVARDENGNALNGSISSFTARFDLVECQNQIQITPETSFQPTGPYLPFVCSHDRDNPAVDPRPWTYRVECGDFPTGTTQRFRVSPSGSSVDIPDGGCKFEIQAPLRGCDGCGDPADTRAWPYFIFVD